MKHPVPKKKKSQGTKRIRHSAFLNLARKKLLQAVQLALCPACGKPKQNHFACPACGSYNGRSTRDIKRAEKRITRVKA